MRKIIDNTTVILTSTIWSRLLDTGCNDSLTIKAVMISVAICGHYIFIHCFAFLLHDMSIEAVALNV